MSINEVYYEKEHNGVVYKQKLPCEIFSDKQSGKNFERQNYQKMKKKLKSDDVLIVKSLDRFGRNYDEIIKEFRYFTELGVKIKVLDMPLLINTEADNLMSKFISDVVLQVLSFVAENERVNIKQRQAEGIRIAKEKGVKFGRPKVVLPQNIALIIEKYINKEITSIEATKLIGISRGTFFNLLKARGLARQRKEKIKKVTKKYKQYPKDFGKMLDSFNDRKISAKEIAKEANLSLAHVYVLASKRLSGVKI